MMMLMAPGWTKSGDGKVECKKREGGKRKKAEAGSL